MRKRDLILLMLFVGIIFISINTFAADYSCDGIFSSGLIDNLDKYLYKPVKYITPVALIVFTSIDFTKVVLSGTKEGFEKAKKNFGKRALAALIIFFAPDVLKLFVNFVQEESIKSCIEGRFN